MSVWFQISALCFLLSITATLIGIGETLRQIERHLSRVKKEKTEP
jgi:hypothetical protein